MLSFCNGKAPSDTTRDPFRICPR